MTRKQLLNFICPTVRKNNCEEYQCSDCTILLNKWLNEYDKNIIEQYNIDTNLKDTIKEIHDSVSIQMYCKGIDDLCKAITNTTVYDECRNEINVLEIARILKKGIKYEV